MLLLVGSLVFYGMGEPVYVALMAGSIFVNYVLARAVTFFQERGDSGRLPLALAVMYNLGLLLFFKYGNFLIKNLGLVLGRKFEPLELSLPLGISFYTFQILSYVIDVYRNEIPAEKNIVDLGAYLSMFPQLIAGPIVTYREVVETMKEPAGRVHAREFEDGLRTFTIGLASKVLLANRFGQLWESMDEAGFLALSTPMAWLGIVAYTLQIYFDFNGYSLMAIGLGRMLGFEFPANFNSPYTACSVTEFWKRWHISLTNFFRKYLYIPLGGNRKGKLCTLRNMLIVWLLTGFWHGADWNFLIWGVYYFILLSIERLIGSVFKKGDKKKRVILPFRVLGLFYTIFAVMIGWTIFAITDMEQMGIYFGRLFAPLLGQSTNGYGPTVTVVTFIWIFIGIIFSTPLIKGIYMKLKKSPLVSLALLALFWLSIAQLSEGAYNPFLYFRF